MERYSQILNEVKIELSKVIVGQSKIIDAFLRAIIAGGNLLIEGVPGLAKTTIIRSLAEVLSCDFNRIQFTADLLPSDIIGINAYNKETGFTVQKGPIFTNLLLADEINRASAKVQSALLEAMAEHQVTIGKQTIELDKPFFVFATENPIESLGTYPLPQAQLDRFLYKLFIDYPTPDEEYEITEKNISTKKLNDYKLKQILTPQAIIEIQEFVKKLYIDDRLKKYIVEIIHATRNPELFKLKLGQYIQWGAGPRGTINLLNSARAQALIHNRDYVTDQDIKDVMYDVLRHRILLNYEGQAKNIKSEHVVTEIFSKVKIP